MNKYALLSNLGRFEVTIFDYVIHDQVEAMTMGQRIAVMRDGVVHQYDRPQVVYEQPANLFVAGFIGSPGMNFVNVVVRTTDKKVELLNQDGLNVALPENTGNRLASNGEQVIMGVRPEHMKLVSVEDTHRCFVGCIAAVEALGFEKLVHVTLGSSTVVVRVPGSTSVRIGENVDVYFPGDAIHIFNKSDGRSLSYGAKSDSPRAVLV